MKKVFLLAALSFLTTYAFSDELLYIEPFSLENGSSWNNVENRFRADVKVSLSYEYEIGSFDIWVPEGLSVQLSAEEQSLGKGDILPFSTDDDDNKVYKHSIDYNLIKSVTREGYVHYRVGAITSSKNAQFKNTAGTLCKIYFGAGSLSDGIYPIYITNVEFSYSTIVGNSVGNTTYVKIGTPAQKTLNVEGDLPSEIINKAISDGVTLNSKRTVANTYGTVCVPFELTSGNGIQYYELSEKTTDQLTFAPVASVAAGKPALFKATAGDLSWSGVPAVPAPVAGENGFTGTFQTITADGYYLANEKVYSGTGFKVPAFRAYLPASSQSGASLRIVIEETNGIIELEADAEGNLTEVFNLQGQRLAAPVKGQVNIINGKKSIIR